MAAMAERLEWFLPLAPIDAMSSVERFVTDVSWMPVMAQGRPFPMLQTLQSLHGFCWVQRERWRGLRARVLFCAGVAAMAAGTWSAAVAVQGAVPPVPEGSAPNDRLKPIDAVVLPSPLMGNLPAPDFAEERFAREPREVQGPGATRAWTMSLFSWEAPALCHRPLYFEDENLERYGQSFGLVQPAVSAGRFAGRALALPYQMGAFPAHECVYTLGKGKPGSYMPYYLYRPPVSARGAIYQAGAVTGLSFIVP
jgi:hypothetical protein